MITLEPGQTFGGIAGTAAVVTYTLFGDERVSPTNAYKQLAQGQLPNAAATLYTSPVSKETLLASIMLANTTNAAITVKFFTGGLLAANQLVTLAIPALGSAYYGRDGWIVYDVNGNRQTVGNQGPQGFQGNQGFQGLQGVQGSQGVQGAQGTQGVQGSVGAPTSLAAVGAAPNANAGTIAGNVLTLQPASVLFPGVMSALDFARARHEYDAYADFGIVEDLRGAEEITTVGTQVVMTSGSNIVNIPNAGASTPFTSTAVDGGKRITVQGAGASGATLVGFIGVVNSSTQCTVLATVGGAALNASTTVTATTSSTVNVQWGTDNAAAWALLATTLNANTYPKPKVVFGGNAQSDWTGAAGMTAPIVLNKAPWFEGIGGGHTADVGDYRKIGGTRIAWWGTSSDGGTAFGAMITVSPTGTQAIKRPQFTNLWLDCRNGDQNQALYGLKMSSVHGAMLDDGFFVMDALAAGVWLDIATSPTEASDTTRFRFGAMCFRQLDDSSMTPPTLTPTTTSTAVTLSNATPQTLTVASVTGFATGGGYAWVQTTIGRPFLVKYAAVVGSTLTNCIVATETAVHLPTTFVNAFVVACTPSKGSAMKLTGGSSHNTSVGVVKQIQISIGTTFGPAGIDLGNSDSITWEQVIINGGSNVTEVNGNRQRRPGVRMSGSTVSASLAARNHVFRDIDPGGSPGGPLGGISVMGVLNTGALMAFPSGPHYVELQQMGNGSPVPTVETGGNLTWTGNGMFVPGQLPVAKPTAAVTLTAAANNVIGGTVVPVPPQGFQVGTHLRWVLPLRKTAAGASITYTVRMSATAAAGSGTAISTCTMTGTAVADDGVMTIDFVVTALGTGSSAAALGSFFIVHGAGTAGASTGLANGAVTAGTVQGAGVLGSVRVRGVATGFDSTAPAAGPQFLFVEINPVTAATALTVDPQIEASCVKAANP